MAAERARKRATQRDLEALPDTVVGELLGGELFVTPRPAPPHATASSAIGGQLWDPFHRPTGSGGPGGWWIIDEPELHIGGDVLVPDLGGWRRERLPALPAGAAFELAPDWACEVISPATARFDRTRKLPIYAREGVSHLWLVDPMAQSLEVYRLEADHYGLVATFGDDAPTRIRAEPFAAIELELARWWER